MLRCVKRGRYQDFKYDVLLEVVRGEKKSGFSHPLLVHLLYKIIHQQPFPDWNHFNTNAFTIKGSLFTIGNQNTFKN